MKDTLIKREEIKYCSRCQYLFKNNPFTYCSVANHSYIGLSMSHEQKEMIDKLFEEKGIVHWLHVSKLTPAELAEIKKCM